MNEIGHKIKLLRIKKGLSQENLANELGITQPSYARLEKEDNRLKITRLIQIANMLEVRVEELIDTNLQNNVVQHKENVK
ncbi:helix-turn-helix transcriptional regulator [uncultured Flavobacterium sp.]|uniref:helix-turn-helix domain-containing protein n=1 Tax=uncultured Flavobacterium sp. TaxID=165435 RepID=UPI0030CA2AFA